MSHFLAVWATYVKISHLILHNNLMHSGFFSLSILQRVEHWTELGKDSARSSPRSPSRRNIWALRRVLLSHLVVRPAETEDSGLLSLPRLNMTADGNMDLLPIEMLGLQVILSTQAPQLKSFHWSVWSVFWSSTMKIWLLMHHANAFVLHVLQILTSCLPTTMVLTTTGITTIIFIIIIIIIFIIIINNMWWETVWAETTMHHIHTNSVSTNITGSTEFSKDLLCAAHFLKIMRLILDICICWSDENRAPPYSSGLPCYAKSCASTEKFCCWILLAL